MEKESNIIKFINTIDKREIGWVNSIEFSPIEYMIPCLIIEYFPKNALKPSIISLDKKEQERFNIFINSDEAAIDFLLENDISIDGILEYLRNYSNTILSRGIEKVSFSKFSGLVVSIKDMIKNKSVTFNQKVDLENLLNFISKKSSNKQISTKQAVEKLCGELKNDKGYYFGWQSNIAMAILDTKRWFLEEHGLKEVPKEMEHSLANKAAIHFLNSLIK